MKHLKLFESFESEGDLSLSESIEKICDKFHVRDYTINPDGTVDVDGSVNLNHKGLTKLPLKFGKVSDNFLCRGNELTTLEGSPIEVGGSFYCDENQLDTLEGGPRIVGDDFYCTDNRIITIGNYPILIGGNFVCNANPICDLYQLFPDCKSFMDSMDYGYLRGSEIIKWRFQEALDELDIEIPDIIWGYRYI